MTKVNVKEFEVTRHFNKGVNKEWTLCEFYGIHRTKHDRTPYHKGSDIELDEINISVKSDSASLMSGSLCKGCKTFEGIWRRYRRNCHSNTFVYITNEFDAYYMTLDEFSKFIHKFAHLEHESTKNGGGLKIKLNTESKKMRIWLDERVA